MGSIQRRRGYVGHEVPKCKNRVALGQTPKCIRPSLAHTLSQGQAPTTHPRNEGAAFLAAQFFSQMGGGAELNPSSPPPRPVA